MITVDFFKKVQKFGPSPALAVETKAGLAGVCWSRSR
jgi:hypothetical protein